ncbi:MAG: A/G-specific adenine glycosylase [Bdellovibrionota bacterium]
MSQQTLISVVLPKFKKFITELPNIAALANCSDDLLRYLWSGLGYYARARNLRNGALFILKHYQGQFPKTKKEWLQIPGCGEYTSSIITSICFSEIVPAIDGNMIRVASRLLGLKEHVWEKQGAQKIAQFMETIMQNYFSSKDPTINASPGDFNQAFMDLGSMLCKKNNPECRLCPLQNSCIAFKKNIVELCPPVKPRNATQSEQVFVLVFINKQTQSYLLVERNSGFLSKTLGFPLFAQKDGFSLQSILKNFSPSSVKMTTLQKTFQHQITHHKITGFVTLLESNWNEKKISEFSHSVSLPNKMQWTPLAELKKQLSSSLDQKVLKALS